MPVINPYFDELSDVIVYDDLKTCRKILKEYEKELSDDPILQLYQNRCKD